MDELAEDQPITVEGETLTEQIERLLRLQTDDDDRWSVRELRRLALMGRITGDISGAVSAHRVLQDALGSLRGGYAEKRRADHDMTDEEADDAILEAAAYIRGKRKAGKSRTKSDISPSSS